MPGAWAFWVNAQGQDVITAVVCFWHLGVWSSRRVMSDRGDSAICSAADLDFDSAVSSAASQGGSDAQASENGVWFDRSGDSDHMVDVVTNCEYVGQFIGDETGQDLVEYSLLLAFIALAGAALFIGMSSSTNTIWSAANSHLAAANGSLTK